MKRLLIIAVTLISGIAHADWTTIAWGNGDDSKPVIAVDYNRSFNNNGIHMVWWKDFTFGNLTIVKRPKNHPLTVYRSRIDCHTRMILNDYSQTFEVKYFEDPNPELYDPPWQGPGQWYVPDINSAAEFLVNFYCKK